MAGNMPANLMYENPVQFAELDMYTPVLDSTPGIICCHFIMKLRR